MDSPTVLHVLEANGSTVIPVQSPCKPRCTEPVFIDDLVTKRFAVPRSGSRCCGAARAHPVTSTPKGRTSMTINDTSTMLAQLPSARFDQHRDSGRRDPVESGPHRCRPSRTFPERCKRAGSSGRHRRSDPQTPRVPRCHRPAAWPRRCRSQGPDRTSAAVRRGVT